MSGLDRRGALALLAAATLVLLAVAGGLWAGRAARPDAPTPLPVARATPVVFPTVAPPDPAAVFRQPLVAGCATKEAVWVVSDGGGIGRFDGRSWALVDPTLRSLFAAACGEDAMLAVGGAGRVLYASDRDKSIRPETTQLDDLNAVALLPDGALAVGTRGVVLRQDRSGWSPYAAGLTEDLYGVAAFGALSAWTVGAGGAAYRLEDAGWRTVRTGVTATLRAVVGPRVDDVVAVGDRGTLLVWDGRWRAVDAGTTADLRAAARGPGGTWVAGARGALLRYGPDAVDALDLRTTCDLRSVFVRGSEVWVVGSDARRAGVWRIVGEDAEAWGTC